MFAGFPRVTAAHRWELVYQQWHAFKVTISERQAEYEVDGEMFAVVELLEGEVPSQGYVGMVRYASDYSFRNMRIMQGDVEAYPATQVEEACVVAVEVGPIWNHEPHAKEVAQQYLEEHPGHCWTGHWWTTVPGKMSVLQIRMPKRDAERVQRGEASWRYVESEAESEPEVEQEVCVEEPVVEVEERLTVDEALAQMGLSREDVTEGMLAEIKAGLQMEEPPAEPEEEERWSEEWDDLLVELTEMGFEDEAQSRKVLSDANGDVKDAVKVLVALERASR